MGITLVAMTDPTDGSTDFETTEKEAALAATLSAEAFCNAPRLAEFLEYVVRRDIAGEASAIKAYAIGVDVLGKDSDFDPGADPIVRVTARRLRDALAEFNASPEGRGLSVRIEMPRGRYVPTFVRQARPSADSVQIRRIWASPFLSIGGTLLALVIAAAIWFAWPRPMPITIPTIDVLPFEAPEDGQRARTILGVRAQLINDLSNGDTLLVHDIRATPHRHEDLSVHYTLKGQTIPGDQSMVITLSDPTQRVIWSRELNLPENDADYQRILRILVSGVALEIAGEHGVVVSDMITRIREREARLGHRSGSEYECLTRAFVFDTTKSVTKRDRVTACLNDLVNAGSVNASVWAQHALMQFLNWSRSSDPQGDEHLDVALSAARRAVQLDPSNVTAHEHLGSILSAKGMREDAIAAYETGLTINPYRPSLNFLQGWQVCLQGDWDEGMIMIDRALRTIPQAPGYMHIPVAMDAFRRSDYVTSLERARQIIDLGDDRGYVLAAAAEISLGDLANARRYYDLAAQTPDFDPSDPVRELRLTFSNPSVIPKYDATIRAHFP